MQCQMVLRKKRDHTLGDLNMSEFEKKYRFIKRESQDGNIKVCETVNADYALIVENEVVAIYEHLQNAYSAFSRLTRKD